MTKFQKFSLFILRVSTGWLMLYAGLTKVFNPQWSAAFYLKDAKTFGSFFQWFMRPEILPVTNWFNEWGLTILGISLILGVFVRLASTYGIVLMLLYYFPILDFPYPDAHSFIVDDHIIYAAALYLLGSYRAGRVWGLENWCAGLPI